MQIQYSIEPYWNMPPQTHTHTQTLHHQNTFYCGKLFIKWIVFPGPIVSVAVWCDVTVFRLYVLCSKDKIKVKKSEDKTKLELTNWLSASLLSVLPVIAIVKAKKKGKKESEVNWRLKSEVYTTAHRPLCVCVWDAQLKYVNCLVLRWNAWLWLSAKRLTFGVLSLCNFSGIKWSGKTECNLHIESEPYRIYIRAHQDAYFSGIYEINQGYGFTRGSWRGLFLGFRGEVWWTKGPIEIGRRRGRVQIGLDSGWWQRQELLLGSRSKWFNWDYHFSAHPKVGTSRSVVQWTNNDCFWRADCHWKPRTMSAPSKMDLFLIVAILVGGVFTQDLRGEFSIWILIYLYNFIGEVMRKLIAVYCECYNMTYWEMLILF